MSQYIPITAVNSASAEQHRGQGRPHRQRVARSARAARRESQPMRPLRCPAMSSAMAAVTTTAPAVAPMASAAAAPPAGSSPVACARRVSVSMCESPCRPRSNELNGQSVYMERLFR